MATITEELPRIADFEKFSKFDVVDGVRTHYYDSVHGEPLVLVHGTEVGHGAATCWTFNITELSKHFRVIAPDEIGYGLTDMYPKPDHSIGARAEHVAKLIRHLNLGRVYMCGQSMGGWIACYIALKYPELLKKMVITNSASISIPDRPATGTPRPYAAPPTTRAEMIEIIKRENYTGRLDRLTDEFVDTKMRYAQRNFAQDKDARETSVGPGARRANTSIDGTHISELLHRINTPNILIWGKNDNIPLEKVIWLFETLKSSELHLFSDSRHRVFFDKYEEFNQLVTSYFSR